VEFDILADYNPLPAGESFHYPKPHAEPAVANVPVRPQAVIAPTPLSARPQYPRDGVVLKPYVAPVQPQTPVGPGFQRMTPDRLRQLREEQRRAQQGVQP